MTQKWAFLRRKNILAFSVKRTALQPRTWIIHTDPHPSQDLVLCSAVQVAFVKRSVVWSSAQRQLSIFLRKRQANIIHVWSERKLQFPRERVEMHCASTNTTFSQSMRSRQRPHGTVHWHSCQISWDEKNRLSISAKSMFAESANTKLCVWLRKDTAL